MSCAAGSCCWNSCSNACRQAAGSDAFACSTACTPLRESHCGPALGAAGRLRTQGGEEHVRRPPAFELLRTGSDPRPLAQPAPESPQQKTLGSGAADTRWQHPEHMLGYHITQQLGQQRAIGNSQTLTRARRDVTRDLEGACAMTASPRAVGAASTLSCHTQPAVSTSEPASRKLARHNTHARPQRRRQTRHKRFQRGTSQLSAACVVIEASCYEKR